jgi:hypothetical protein
VLNRLIGKAARLAAAIAVVLVLVFVLVLGTAAGLPAAGQGRRGPRASLTSDAAVNAVARLPEVKAWGKFILESTGGKVHGALMVMPEEPVVEEGKRYWSVEYLEDQPDHMHRWQTFLIRLDGKEILVDDPVSGDYVSLAEWRATQKPMERIRPAAGESPEDFLRRLYDYHRPWERREATEEGARPQFFEESLDALFRSAEECTVRKQDMGELDFDPILSAQDFPDDGISPPVVRAVPSKVGATYEATFRLFPKISKKQTTVTYELARTAKGWRIHDISWGKQYRTLRQLLEDTCK